MMRVLFNYEELGILGRGGDGGGGDGGGTDAAAQAAADFGAANQQAANNQQIADAAFAANMAPEVTPPQDVLVAEINPASLSVTTARNLVNGAAAVVSAGVNVVTNIPSVPEGIKAVATTIGDLTEAARVSVQTGITNAVNAANAAETRAADQNNFPAPRDGL